jgi:hypothetical protein
MRVLVSKIDYVMRSMMTGNIENGRIWAGVRLDSGLELSFVAIRLDRFDRVESVTFIMLPLVE